MSGRTRKHGERAPLDAYYTDDRVAWAIVQEVMRHIIIMDEPPLRILEPHVGGGAFIRAFKRLNNPKIKYTAMDLNPESEGLKLADTVLPCGDFLEFAENWNPKRKPYDIVIGNPPFSDDGVVVAHEHIEAARKVGRWVIMLTRVGLFTALRRREWCRKFKPLLTYDLAPRPSFTGRGTDSAEYRVSVIGPYLPHTSRHNILWWKE